MASELAFPVSVSLRSRRAGQMIFGCCLLYALTGCADRLDPALDIPSSYRAVHSKSGTATARAEWWRDFRSAELTDLMEQARSANLDIAAAVARIAEADAQWRIVGAALLPSISGTADDTRSRASSEVVNVQGRRRGMTVDRTVYGTVLNASYVLDVWGRNRALTRAAGETAVASNFDWEVIRLAMLVSVANTYFLVLEGQDRLRVARENLAASERVLKLIQDRLKIGTAAALDVAQQASLAAIQRASIPPLQVQIEQNKATLGLLVGRSPEHITVRGGSMYRLTIPQIAPGLPSELLEQRPDVREAEARLRGADANVEAAREAFFPTIQLTGVGGVQSSLLHSLFTPGAFFYQAAASLTQPIFDGGLLLGQLDLQSGTRVELLQNYRKSVISAFTDVEKALTAVHYFARQEQLQRDAVRESRHAFELSEERLRAGTIDLTTLLQAEQTLFQQEDTLAQVRFARLQAVVSLYQALGGGWLLSDLPGEKAKVP